MDIITRKQAKEQGLGHYFTGKPCKRGHMAHRHTANASCSECLRVGDRERKRAAYQAKSREARRPSPEKKEYYRLYARHRRQTDASFRIADTFRRKLNQMFSRRQGRHLSAESLLGCKFEEAVKHLEAQFQPGMSWDNNTRDGWHIDHIRPCASFDLTDPEQLGQCFHYTNLQPLWAEENQRKGAKLVA